ncbi:pimeloyl-ACP methyl ester carboxylesterase [Amaricoccus macauensis]|uniref:Pimeloyl-ACP methyl ester carboxylesterase n=1 Tax=Amaricoccus macauensis TaxID=57001 RepID=A0A840SLM7_9RHOB|nr:pimeloyl-ACP methyl ester carboxylesterase [Amaricoccus macauensis]
MRLFEFDAEIDGAPEAPPLLMVHGLLTSRRQWLPNVERLSRHFRLIRVDLPAHGDAAPGADPAALSPARLVDGLDRLRARLGIGRWMLCGQSAGAALTLRYALDYPSRVAAQIFTNANAVIHPSPDEAYLATHTARVARLRNPARNGLDREAIHPRHARRFPAPIRETLVAEVARMDPAAFADFLDALMPRVSLRYQLPRLTVPTLLINGRHEHRFQPLRNWIETNVPMIGIVDLDGGHSINIENAEGFDAAALHFLEPYAEALAQVAESQAVSLRQNGDQWLLPDQP